MTSVVISVNKDEFIDLEENGAFWFNKNYYMS